MVKRTEKYVDFDGNERTEDFYFNISPAELYELQFSENGGMGNLMEKISKEQDFTKIVEYFKRFVLLAFGEKSLDGKYLFKDEETKRKFQACPAYSQIFMDLATDAEVAAKFMNEVQPPKEVMDKYIAKLKKAEEDRKKAGDENKSNVVQLPKADN